MLWRGPTEPAGAAVQLVSGKAEEVCARLDSEVREAFGVEDEKTQAVDISARMTKLVAGDSTSGQSVSRLISQGLTLGAVKQRSWRTRRYNQADGADGWSQAEFSCIDGASVVRDCPLTLVGIRRIDHWRGWGREFHTGIPVPWKVRTESYLVTSKETAMADRAIRNRWTASQPIPVRLWWEPLLDVELLEQVVASCGSAGRAAPEARH